MHVCVGFNWTLRPAEGAPGPAGEIPGGVADFGRPCGNKGFGEVSYVLFTYIGYRYRSNETGLQSLGCGFSDGTTFVGVVPIWRDLQSL